MVKGEMEGEGRMRIKKLEGQEESVTWPLQSECDSQASSAYCDLSV